MNNKSASQNPRIRPSASQNPRIRILLATGIYPPAIGGPATYSQLLFNELPKLGFNIEILTYGNRNQKAGNIFIVSNKWPKGLKHFIYFLKALYHGFGTDLIYAQDPTSVGLPTILAAKILCKKFVIKLVGDYAWEQGVQRFGVNVLLDDFQNNKYGFLVEILRFIQQKVCKNADCIITPSFYLKKIVSGWGIGENKIKAIYNAVDVSEINFSKKQAREKLMVGANYKIILSIGRDVPWKGFSRLAAVCDELKKEIPDIKLIILGKDKKYPREAIFLNLRAADAFVLNTGYEGLSHQILEAMAVGVPVITTNVGGNPELIKDGQNGLLVEYNDKNELKEAIKKVLFNKVDVNSFVKKSREFVGSLTEKKMISELINIFNSI